MRGLTIRQKEIYDFMKVHIQRYGYAPTLKEIANHFKVSSPAIYYVVDALVKKGWISHTKYSERDFVINEI